MRSRIRQAIALIILLIAIIVLFFVYRLSTRAAFGPAVALCPGPDQYGYTCESGGGFVYFDASIDTFLYEDDATTSVDLPFPFVFYGTTYTEIQISSNGNMQFGNDNAAFSNACLTDGPVPNMGDMIAPYWDDLDLRSSGFLEHETIGAPPERVFVIEWDNVPRFGDDSGNGVTFEVQLFEKNNDIVFLYENVMTLEGYNGSSATIGMQSEAQQLALHYGCDQPVVANASGIYFPHPDEPNQDSGLDTVSRSTSLTDPNESIDLIAKGHVAELVMELNQWGPTVLSQLRDHWINQTPSRISEWRWLDLSGDGRNELLLLWRGHLQDPGIAQIVVLVADETGQMTLQYNDSFPARQLPGAQPTILDTADLTHDGNIDVLLGDKHTGQLFVVSSEEGGLARHPILELCQGSVVVLDVDNDGRLDIVRDGCESEGRISYVWDGHEFVRIGKTAGE